MKIEFRRPKTNRAIGAALVLSVCLLMNALPAAAAEVDIVNAANNAIRAQQAGERHEALELYTLIIDSEALNPGEHLLTYVYNNRGVLWRDFGEYEKAIADFTRAIENRPDAVSYMSRGNTWVDLGEDEKAIQDYTESLNLRPEYARVYNHRAFAWLNLSRPDKAKADFERARMLDPAIENLTID